MTEAQAAELIWVVGKLVVSIDIAVVALIVFMFIFVALSLKYK